MISNLSFNGVDYKIINHVSGKGEKTYSLRLERVDGTHIKQSKTCRDILESYGYIKSDLKDVYGNFTLAGLVYKAINGIEFDIKNYKKHRN